MLGQEKPSIPATHIPTQNARFDFYQIQGRLQVVFLTNYRGIADMELYAFLALPFVNP